jgi:hypothetical protein
MLLPLAVAEPRYRGAWQVVIPAPALSDNDKSSMARLQRYHLVTTLL